MLITKELLNQIKPKERGKSDKFSWNFYKILNKYKGKDIKFYHSNICNHKEIPITYSKDTLLVINIFVSVAEYGNYLVGNTLGLVLREGKFQEFQLMNYKLNHTDITEEFINTYLEIGRCLFDASHNGWIQYDKERFTVNGVERTCNWCGKHQVKMSETVTRTRDYWADSIQLNR